MMLPTLAFGQADASISNDLAAASDTMARIVPTMKIAPAANAKDVRTKISTYTIGDVRILAHAATPCTMHVDESKGWHLIMPYMGVASLNCDGKMYDVRSGVSALLLPNMQRSTERAPSSVVIASLDIGRLEKTIAIRAGRADEIIKIPSQPLNLHLDHTRALFRIFVQLCEMIDTARGTNGLGEALGIDDMLYRWIASALSVVRCEKTDSKATSRIEAACDLIRSSRDRPLTLTEMEEASGLSARSLQYAFRERFNCSPMAWQRRERMILARQRLITIGQDETITTIAHSMAYSSSAAFAALYKRHFGETPSQTLAKILAR